MDKEKLKYVAYIAIPIVLLGFVYYFFIEDGSDNSNKQFDDKNKTDNLADLVENDSTYRKKSKSEIYEDLSRREKRKMQLSGKRVSDDDFFGGSLEPRNKRDEEFERYQDSIIQLNEESKKQQKLISEPKPTDSYQRTYERKVSRNSQPDHKKKSVSGGSSKSKKSGFFVKNYNREEKESEKKPVTNDGRRRRRSSSGFYNSNSQSSTSVNFISAVIHDEVQVARGSIVPVRLTESAVIDGNDVPKNTIVYGNASFSQNRIQLNINSLNINNEIIPVKMAAFDFGDANMGLAVNDKNISEKLDQTRNRASSGVNVTVPMIGSVNIGNLTRSNRSDIKIQVPAGYKILIKSIEER